MAFFVIRLLVRYLQLSDRMATWLHNVSIQVIARINVATPCKLVRVDSPSLLLYLVPSGGL